MSDDTVTMSITSYAVKQWISPWLSALREIRNYCISLQLQNSVIIVFCLYFTTILTLAQRLHGRANFVLFSQSFGKACLENYGKMIAWPVSGRPSTDCFHRLVSLARTVVIRQRPSWWVARGRQTTLVERWRHVENVCHIRLSWAQTTCMAPAVGIQLKTRRQTITDLHGMSHCPTRNLACTTKQQCCYYERQF